MRTHRLIFSCAVMLGAVLFSAAPAQEQEGSNRFPALSYLPAEAEAVAMLQKKAFSGPESALEGINSGEFLQLIPPRIRVYYTNRNGQVSGSVEAAFRILLNDEDSNRIARVAGGVFNLEEEKVQRDYAVVLGEFSEQEGWEIAEEVRASDPSAEGIAQVPATRPEPVYLKVPRDGVILITNDWAWLEQAPALAEENSGATREGGALAAMLEELDQDRLDGLLFLHPTIIDKAAGDEAVLQVIAGPLLLAQGIAGVLYSGEPPSFQAIARFSSEEQARQGKEYLDELLKVLKERQSEALFNAHSYAERRQIRRRMALLETVDPKAEDNLLLAEYNIIPRQRREPGSNHSE